MSARAPVWVAAIAIAVATSGCAKRGGGAAEGGTPEDGRWWAAGAGGSPGDEVDGDEAELEILTNVRRIFVAHCAPCHSGHEGVAEGGFGAIFDPRAMIARGLISPGEEASASPLFLRVVNEEMPPPGAVDPADPSNAIGPVSRDDQGYIARWIEAGAFPLEVRRTPLTGLELRQVMAEDAAALPEADLPFYRYVSLSATHGSSLLTLLGVEAVVNVTSTLLNSLSPSRAETALPKLLLSANYDPVALRVDLRDYDLDAADWARLEAASEVVDRQGFPCKVPFLGVEQLLPLALNDEHVRADGRVESVYSNIVLRRALERAGLLAPGQLVFEPREAGAAGGPLVSAVTLPELAAALGVNLQADIAQGGEAAFRLCVREPALSTPSRCVQRDAMAGGEGRGFWWSMQYEPDATDQLPSSLIGPANGGLVAPAAGVTPFALKEGSALWPWPNQTSGFALFDDQLRLRSTTTQYTNLFFPMADPSLGLTSCPSCHADGPVPAVDDLGPALDRGEIRPGGFTAAELAFVDRLFRPQIETDERFASDNVEAREVNYRTCMRNCDAGFIGLSELSALTFGILTRFPADQAAVRLYLDPKAFPPMVSSDPELQALLPRLDEITQDQFVRAFPALRQRAIAAGVDVAALNFCAVPAGG